METESKLENLRSFCKSVAGHPCVAKVVLYNIAWHCFGITFRLFWLVVEIHIIRTKAIQGHVWSPTVVPEFEFVTQFRQMINAVDKSNPFKPFIFQSLLDSFCDSDRAVFANGT